MSAGGKRKLFPKFVRDASAFQAKEPPVTFTATPKQAEWIAAVMSLKFKFMAIGGGIRGTKTIACLVVIVLLCRIYPRSRWAIVRKDLPTLRRNVIPSLEKVRLWSGGFVGPLKQDTWTYTCANGSQIILFAEQFIQDPELERWKGLEVNGFDLEEANELAEKSGNKAIERAGSYVIPATPEDPEPKQPPPFIFCNFNPCAEWPRKWFYEPFAAGTIAAPYYFLPATIADNPFASEDYKDSLKYLPKEEYDRYVKGEWDFIDDPTQLIKSEWVWAARNVEVVDGPVRLGGDIARYGDDWTSLIVMKGNQFRKHVSMKHFDLTRVSTTILNLAAEPELPISGGNVRIDAVGLGAGVVDICRAKGLPVVEVIAGAKPFVRTTPPSFFRYKDLRSQIWWEGREKFRTGQVCLHLTNAKGVPEPLPEKLVGDLASPRYEISGDRLITVESKDEIKLRLGRSTDDGDALMMAIFDMPTAPRRPVLPGSVIIRGH
jgi:hypothetical protein